MAALFAGAALIINVATFKSGKDAASDNIAKTEVSDSDQENDRYISELADGAQMDDYSLYVYLTANE
jgi:hypothetical protein